MRVRFLLPLVFLAVGCDDYGYYDRHYGGDNEIVFGIQQRTVTTPDGAQATEVSAGYDFLRLAKRGGWGPAVFRDGDGEGTCYFESFDDRLGKPRVEDGTAMFTGGTLPSPNGLQLLANQPEDTKYAGAGWADGDVLTFDVMGFAMPRIPTLEMYAPRTKLEGTTIAPAPSASADPSSVGSSTIEIRTSDAVGVTWARPTEGARSRVMVSLETEEEGGRGSQVRCFGRSESGSAVIPAEWVARLFSTVDPDKPIKGHLEIASHRQYTYYGRGNWIVYFVATTLHEQHAFTGVR